MANRAMRVRRVTNAEEFWASLEMSEPDVLPLWFSDAERDWIARTIDRDLAMLGPADERSFAELRIACSADDLVLATSPAVAPVARRYASITGRPFIAGSTSQVASARPPPRSVTWFCPLDENDIASALHSLRRELTEQLGQMPRLGVLTAMSVSRLTWLLAKQLVPIEAGQDPATTLVSNTPRGDRPSSSLTILDNAQTVEEVVAGFGAAQGTLLVHAHSRPHCGIMEVSDGAVGMCGLSARRAPGRCLDGIACYFGEAPRVVLEDIQAQRIYFNGCTTAGVGGRRDDFLPHTSMVSHAALRSTAREFIGNVHVGHYSDADIDWFLGASVLGYTPAECAEIIEVARTGARREVIQSVLYFGDATNPAWPVRGASSGEVEAEAECLRIHWSHLARVLVARVPEPTWADLAEADCLHVHTQHPSQPIVSIIKDPWHKGSLVLATPSFDREPADSALGLSIELRALARPVVRAVGDVLARAIEHTHWLEALPAFSTLLANGSRQLEEELITLRRYADWRENLMMVPETLAYLRDREAQVARRFDGAVIDEALARSQKYWNWQREYSGRMRATPRAHPSSCPSCDGFAKDTELVDRVNPRIERVMRVCAYCGIIADLPTWGLRVRLAREVLEFSATALCGRAEVTNDEDRPRHVTLGVAIERAGAMQPGAKAKAELIVGPGERATFEFSLVPERPMSDLMQTRVYIASEGAFGLVNTNLLYGRVPSGDTPAAPSDPKTVR